MKRTRTPVNGATTRAKLTDAIAAMNAARTAGDPVCAKRCGRCHYCLRKLYGPDYWMREPKP